MRIRHRGPPVPRDKLHKEIQALRVLMAAMLKEKGGRWFVSDAELEALPANCQIIKRRSESLAGYDLALEVLPE